jgi:predicted outer membrane repeat protein
MVHRLMLVQYFLSNTLHTPQNTAISEAGVIFAGDGACINIVGAVQVVGNSARRSGAVSLQGAAMLVEGTALFRDNVATGATAAGGAVYVAGASLTVLGAKFVANAANTGSLQARNSPYRDREA